MKLQESKLNESVLTEASYFSEQNKKNNPVFCSFNKPAIHGCMNDKCKKSSFLCLDQACNCAKEHNKCFKISLKSLVENIEEKRYFADSLEKFINNGIEEIIDFLSKYRDETISKMKKDFEFFGLKENERDFLKEIKNGKCQKTTGSRIWEIIHSERQKCCATKIVEFACKTFENNFKNAKQNCETAAKNITSTINSLDSSIQKSFKVFENSKDLLNIEIISNASKIFTSFNQFSTIQNFFAPKKIKSANLIFKASQNNFSAQKFHQKCDGVPDTLVLVETEFGKKIGGYTPIIWSSQNAWMKDESMTSFLFSLTNGDKFQLTNKEQTVYHYSNHGPRFGGGADLIIYDKANENTSSSANINHTYKNEKYQYNDKQAWEKFSGGSSSSVFKIKQWQVWSLQLC